MRPPTVRMRRTTTLVERLIESRCRVCPGTDAEAVIHVSTRLSFPRSRARPHAVGTAAHLLCNGTVWIPRSGRTSVLVVTMHKMTSANGVEYLVKSVAVGDGDRRLDSPTTRYYTDAGTPPGTWMGNGVALLGHDADARLRPGDAVTEDALRLLLGQGRDPLSGHQLGRAPGRYVGPPRNRAGGSGGGRSGSVAPRRQAVAGFDFTFSPPKSVSALWAVADAGTQSLIAEAHHAAVADVLDLLERRVAVTRIGTNGVARVPVAGVIAAAFDHYESRTGDPQLHTHVVIANRVLGPDGVWRTLYGNPLHKATVALSETFDAALMDRLHRDLGLEFARVDRGPDRNTGLEVAGVPEALRAAFSSRTTGRGTGAGIDARKAELIADYVDRHGRQPSARVAIRLRQQATLETRPAKTVRSLADSTRAWRTQASEVLGEDATRWARALLADTGTARQLRGDDLAPQVLDDLAAAVLQEVGEKRAVWGHWNLWAEAARQTAEVRFASAIDREMVLDAVVGRAEDASLRLTPAYERVSPGLFRLADGSSAFSPRSEVSYSSQALLDAEGRLLDATSAASVQLGWDRVEPFTLLPDASGFVLSADQAVAVSRIATSGRALDVLVGPAGAGKTTALRVLRAAWEGNRGTGSVVGLAPSAAAAEVLGDALGIRTENTAKWSHEHAAGRWDLRPGQLVIVDEASLTGTLMLDRLVAHAREAGAKVLLVGDWAQLSAVESGGAFGLIARAIEGAPELTDVRRFRQEWEKSATLDLRGGAHEVVQTYAEHGRIHEDVDPAEAAFAAWRADTEAGRRSILLAVDAASVAELGARARADRVAAGHVTASGRPLHDGNTVGVGDVIVTRRNDRRLLTGRGWVKNGDRWHVVKHFEDGALTVRRVAVNGRTGAAVTLPAGYVAQHVELGYASTVHRAQGLTVDTAHAVINTDSATRELLYVAMTRGADANHVYVAADSPTDDQLLHEPARSAEAKLGEVLARVGSEPTATETLRLALSEHTSLATLIREYETIAAHAVSIGIARWPRHTGLHRTRIADLITTPGGTLPADYATALQQRERAILTAARETATAAVDAREPWTRGVSPRMLESTAIYRAKYSITDPSSLGTPLQPGDRWQTRDYQLVRRARVALTRGLAEWDSPAIEAPGLER